MEVFERFHTAIEPRSRLHLVGDTTDHPAYVARLRRLARACRRGVRSSFRASVSDGALAAYYRTADLFLCLSEHEGFGLPPLVAAAHGVPVLARLAGALAEGAVGEAGILFDDAEPRRVAELAHVVVRDDDLRRSALARRRAAPRADDPAAVQRAWAAVLAEVRAMKAATDVDALLAGLDRRPRARAGDGRARRRPPRATSSGCSRRSPAWPPGTALAGYAAPYFKGRRRGGGARGDEAAPERAASTLRPAARRG
jgi:hypothetical protein